MTVEKQKLCVAYSFLRNAASAANAKPYPRRDTLASRGKKIPDIDIEDVVPEASLIEDLGADSLTIVELVMSMEEVFDIEISDDQAAKLLTVEDAVNHIKKGA